MYSVCKRLKFACVFKFFLTQFLMEEVMKSVRQSLNAPLIFRKLHIFNIKLKFKFTHTHTHTQMHTHTRIANRHWETRKQNKYPF